MNLSFSHNENPSELDVLPYARWQDILRSWFWRYYDNLFQLTFLNLGWFLTCFGVEWLTGITGLLAKSQTGNWFGLYLVYVLECAVSVPWALAVFKIFMEDGLNWNGFVAGLRRCFGKALIAAALSGFLLGLAFYDIRFYLSLPLASHPWIFVLMGLVTTMGLYGLMMTFYQWPILFFQEPSIVKLVYRSFLITLGTGPNSLFLLFFSVLAVVLFSLEPFLWFFIGFVFLFSIYTVALEKHFLRYKITYQDKPIDEYLEFVNKERQRGWRDIFRPWETR